MASKDPQLKDLFRNYQYRQELHDQLFHKDIYTLPKSRRLAHLVLHHGKYISRVYQYIHGTENPKGIPAVGLELYTRTLVDGIVVAFSILNTLNMDFIEEAKGFSVGPATLAKSPGKVVDRLICLMGDMAKAVEDIDHLAHLNVGKILGQSAVDLIFWYGSLLSTLEDPSEGWFWDSVLGQCVDRLVMVEEKNCFCKQLTAEMDKLLETRK